MKKGYEMTLLRQRQPGWVSRMMCQLGLLWPQTALRAQLQKLFLKGRDLSRVRRSL